MAENPRWPPKQGKIAFFTLDILLLRGIWFVICHFLGYLSLGMQFHQKRLRQKIQYGGKSKMAAKIATKIVYLCEKRLLFSA